MSSQKYSFLIITIFFNISSEFMYSRNLDDLCSQINYTTINLERSENSSLLVKHISENEHSLECEFKINYPVGMEGVFAVIQNLSFRMNNTTKECIDYVQFIARNGSHSKKFCGSFNATEEMGLEAIDISAPVAYRNSFKTTGDQLRVVIFMSEFSPNSHESSDLNIVFTAYKGCKNEDDFKPCSKISKDCIHKSFFDDGLVNCPLPNCVDENGCKNLIEKPKVSVGSKVLVGSLSVVVVIFSVFVICIWICRKYHVLCWSDDVVNTTTTRSSPSPRTIEMEEQPVFPEHITSVPSVPSDDKDLPPSYDTLFPTRSLNTTPLLHNSTSE